MNFSLEIMTGAEAILGPVMVENTEIVNKEMEYSFMLLTIPVCLLIVMLNLSVLVTLWRIEKTVVNKMMKLDCIVNILYAFLCTFQQSPFFRGIKIDVYCFPHTVLSFAFGVGNRLLPVSIASFR